MEEYDRMIEALDSSIIKWEKIVTKRDVDLGSDNCDLCWIAHKTHEKDSWCICDEEGCSCERCIIVRKMTHEHETGCGCINTPWFKWFEHHKEIHHYNPNEYDTVHNLGIHDGCKECEKLAKKFLDFLEEIKKNFDDYFFTEKVYP